MSIDVGAWRMNVLICPIGSPGFVYPMFGIARDLTRRGHEVRIATNPAFEREVRCAGLKWGIGADAQRTAFSVRTWWAVDGIVQQARLIAEILTSFPADVLLTSELSLGSLLAAEEAHLPLAVMGLAGYTWPTEQSFDREEMAGRLSRAKSVGFLDTLNRARPAVGLPARDWDPERPPFIGDRYLLRSIEQMEPLVCRLPRSVQLIGSCVWTPTGQDRDLRSWLESERDRPLLYVQHGTSFGGEPFWWKLVEAAGNLGVRVVASVGRLRDPPKSVTERHLYVRDHVFQDWVLPYASAVVASGNTTAVLGALSHGRPMLLVPVGGEQPMMARRCAELGVAITLHSGGLTAAQIRDALAELLNHGLARETSRQLQVGFEAVDGPRAVGDALEEIATSSGDRV
jgi:UDP:flavonoid glycosyltransferase YjiC (YdhE family)